MTTRAAIVICYKTFINIGKVYTPTCQRDLMSFTITRESVGEGSGPIGALPTDYMKE